MDPYPTVIPMLAYENGPAAMRWPAGTIDVQGPSRPSADLPINGEERAKR